MPEKNATFQNFQIRNVQKKNCIVLLKIKVSLIFGIHYLAVMIRAIVSPIFLIEVCYFLNRHDDMSRTL